MTTKRARATQTVAAILLTSACALLAAWAAGVRPSRAQGQAGGASASPGVPQGRSALYGRAVNEATGRPLRHARIMLMVLGGARSDHSARTDARGEFRIANLPAGRYVVWAEVEGMLTPAGVGASSVVGDVVLNPDDIRRYFEVVDLDGKAEREVTVRARRGGAVTGRVTYADGDPAVGVVVHLLRREGEGRPATPARPAGFSSPSPRTDDRGVYRIAGLPPGEYLVAVAEPADHTGAGAAVRADMSDVPGLADFYVGRQLLMTYHPASTSLKGAEAVAVRAGEESAGVDVTIPERELRTISGVVRAARGGRPLTGAKVSIAPQNEDLGGDRPFLDLSEGARADADGRWQLREIPDGLYTLHIQPPDEYEEQMRAAMASGNFSSMNRNGPMEPEAAASAQSGARRRKYAPLRRELRVSGDVAELVVELGEGARVSGSVVVEGGKDTPYLYVYARRVAKNFEESIGDGPLGSQVGGGAFEIEGMPPGKYFLQARDFTEEGGFYIKSITWQGRDLMREPLEVAEGAHVEGVRIVYATNPAALLVRVSGAGKQPAYNVSVFLLPADLTRWSVYMPPLLCSTGGDGSCRVSAPPGDYVVVTAALNDLYSDPEGELRRRAAAAPRVTLRAGEEKTIETVYKEK